MSTTTTRRCDLCGDVVKLYEGAQLDVVERRTCSSKEFTNDHPHFDLCDSCWQTIATTIKQMFCHDKLRRGEFIEAEESK